jgi:hypothetical protein
MSGPIDDATLAGGEEADRVEHRRARKREWNRRYKQEHPEQYAATRRKWVDANRDRIRESNRRWREAHLEHARELNRDSMRRAADRKRRQDAQRREGRERARVWRLEHPDRVREYQAQWVAANRDKMREYYNRYYETHRDEVNARATARRDADPERIRAVQKDWAERHKGRRAELQRERRADPEAYQAELEANAAARRLKRRLARAGLPPKRLHPASAGERRANEREADAFFASPSLGERTRQASAFCDALTKHMLRHSLSARESARGYVAQRERMGLPPVRVEDTMWALAVEVVLARSRRVDRLTSRDVASAVGCAKAVVKQHEREQQFAHLVRALVNHLRSNEARLIAEAEIENKVRTVGGKTPLSVNSLVVQLGLYEVAGRVPMSRLTLGDTRSAAREASLQVLTHVVGVARPAHVTDDPALFR